MASFEPAPTCDELKAEELEELCRIYDCMVKVVQSGPRCGEVEIEGLCETMVQAFFGAFSSNPSWRAKEAWDYLLKKPIPLSNGRCVICVPKEYDPKTGEPCKLAYVTLCADDEDECPNSYCGWDYVALAKATSEMWSWFYASGFLNAGAPVAPDGSQFRCPILVSSGTERVEIGKGAAAMWHPLFSQLPLEDQAKLDKCGPCYDPSFVPEGWDATINENGEACFFSFIPVNEWKEQYVYVNSIDVLLGGDCPDLCNGQSVVIDGRVFPVYKKEDGTLAVDVTGLPVPPTPDTPDPDLEIVSSYWVRCNEDGTRDWCKELCIVILDENGVESLRRVFIDGAGNETDTPPEGYEPSGGVSIAKGGDDDPDPTEYEQEPLTLEAAVTYPRACLMPDGTYNYSCHKNWPADCVDDPQPFNPAGPFDPTTAGSAPPGWSGTQASSLADLQGANGGYSSLANLGPTVQGSSVRQELQFTHNNAGPININMDMEDHGATGGMYLENCDDGTCYAALSIDSTFDDAPGANPASIGPGFGNEDCYPDLARIGGDPNSQNIFEYQTGSVSLDFGVQPAGTYKLVMMVSTFGAGKGMTCISNMEILGC